MADTAAVPFLKTTLAVQLLRLITARAAGEIGGPTVDAKIDELTERVVVDVDKP